MPTPRNPMPRRTVLRALAAAPAVALLHTTRTDTLVPAASQTTASQRAVAKPHSYHHLIGVL
jgi:hypothetical protein